MRYLTNGKKLIDYDGKNNQLYSINICKEVILKLQQNFKYNQLM